MKILGVDLGGVVFNEWTGAQVPEAMEFLRMIVQSNQFDRVYIVSKAPTIVARFYFRTILRRQNFWEYTGIPQEHLYFCNRYSDKAKICENLGVTDFVDDRLQVLHHLDSARINRYALNHERRHEHRKYHETAQNVTKVSSWRELSDVLLS